MNSKIKAPTIITAHTNADFDSLSSMVAAQMLYPEAVLIIPGSQEQSLRDFFIQSATYLLNFYTYKDIDPESVNTIVICDTAHSDRVPHISHLLEKQDVEIHIFDHHPDSEEDIPATYKLVRPWGATVSVLYSLLVEKGIFPSPEQATLMGLGLYEDTGCFTFSSTTEHDLRTAADLKSAGMDIEFISDFLNRELSSEQVSILNTLLETAQTHTINNVEVCITEVSTEKYVQDFAILIHKMMEIENIKVVFALARMQDRIHVVARSKLSSVNAGTICSSLGGGGHSFAASATIKSKTLVQVRDELFGLLYSHINPQIKVNSLMSSPPITITQEDTISRAAEAMTRFGLKAIPIVEAGGKRCMGILEHQLAERARNHGLGEFEVKEYMLYSFSIVTREDSLYTVMEIIINQGQRLVPVVENEHIIGVITRTDLINTLVDEPARIPETLNSGNHSNKNLKALMKTRLPEDIFKLLQKAGELARKMDYNVYAVGGFVRDIMLHRPNLDIDLVVEGNGIKFAEALSNEWGGRFRSHKKFKTAVVILPDNQRIDVATARMEYYEHPAALPTVELSSIKMDLFRRDFSMNSLAIQLNPKNFGLLVDFFGGQKDIKDKVIRVLHSLSFVEDPTRILRAIRFEQRFDFRIGVQTERLIKNALYLNMFHKLSGNRIFQELKLIFEESSPLTCLTRMEKYNMLQAIHPELKLNQGKEKILESIKKILDWYELLYTSPTPETWKVFFLGLLTGCNQDQVQMICRRFNFHKKELDAFTRLRQEVQTARERLFRWHKNESSSWSQLYFILESLPVEGCLYIMASSKIENIRKNISYYLSQLKHEQIEVNGKDLKVMGLTPGPAYNRILTKILEANIDGWCKDRQSQLALAEKLVHQEKDKA